MSRDSQTPWRLAPLCRGWLAMVAIAASLLAREPAFAAVWEPAGPNLLSNGGFELGNLASLRPQGGKVSLRLSDVPAYVIGLKHGI